MGSEASCTVHVGRKSAPGKALLESEELLVRGELRVRMAFADIRRVAVDGGALVVATKDEEARLDLAPGVAERWARAIQSPKGLFDKLGLAPDARVAVLGLDDAGFVAGLRGRGANVSEGRVAARTDVVFLGVATREALGPISRIREHLVDTGALWIVRPKGAGKDVQVTEKDVLTAVRAAGLVDVKVVSFSKTHTAHKCVVPVEKRGQARG